MISLLSHASITEPFCFNNNHLTYCRMGQVTSQPALTVKVVLLSLVVKKTTCADALQPSATHATRGRRTYRTIRRFWNCQLLLFALPSHPSRNTEHPGGSSKVPTSEFGHLLGIHELTGHPGSSLERADICVWSLIQNWKTYRTSGKFLESANI